MARKKRPTQADVARLAGVSQTTVSMIINDNHQGTIPEATIQKVQQAMFELGYSPDAVAQMLARGSKRIIGVFTYEHVFPYAETDFFFPYLQGINSQAGQKGYNVLLFTSQQQSGTNRIYANTMNSLSLADGAILFGAEPNREELCRLSSEGYPFVYIGRREVPGCEIDWVTHDYRTGSYDAIQYLVELGHRKIGVIGSLDASVESETDKLAGCQQAAADFGNINLVILPKDIVNEPDELLHIRSVENLSALVCNEMWNFSRVLEILEQADLRVPDDVSLLSLSSANVPRFTASVPTCVQLDQIAVGQIATRTLMNRIQNSQAELQQITQPTQLVIGQTTGPISE